MARAVPKAEREKIVSAYHQGLGTAAEIAKIFNIAERTVFKYIRQQKETGDLTPKKQPGNPPIITERALGVIKSIVIANPDGTLEGYREQLKMKTGIDVTVVTIFNACKKLGFRRKKRVFSLLNRNVRTSKRKGQII